MRKKTLTQETVAGILWQSVSVLANVFLRAGILILLTRNLRAVDFGIIAAATVIVSITRIFSEIGVARALVQRLDLHDQHIRAAFIISSATGAIACIAIFFSANLVSDLFRMPGLTPYVQFISITLLLNGISTVSASLLQRDRRFRTSASIEIASYVLGFGLIALPLAKSGFGAWSLAVAFVVQSLSRTFALIVVRRPSFGLISDWVAFKDLLRVGSGFTMGQVANFVATQVDYLIVGRWLGAEALGYYNRAYQFLMLPAQLFGTAVASVLFPSIASIQDQPERVARAYVLALGVVALTTLPVSGLLIIVAPELIRFVLGPEWNGMTQPFRILIASLLFRTSYKISDSISLAMGSMVARAWRQWVYAGAVAGGALIGTQWGIAGVAFGVCGAVFINFVLMTQLALQITGVSIKDVIGPHVRQIIASLLMLLPVYGMVKVLRDFELGRTAIVSSGVLGALLTGSILWFGFRRLFGREGEWLWSLVSSGVQSRGRKK